MERKVVYFQVLAIWKMGDLSHKAHLHIYKEGEGSRTEIGGGG